MNSGTKIKQRDVSDCGAACLASVAAHYGLKIPVSQIRQIAGTDTKGTNALGMIEAAEKLGFSAKGVKGGIDALTKIPVPAIAHVIKNGVLHHYLVIYQVKKDRIKVMDPASGEIEVYQTTEFNNIWSSVLILLIPNEGFTPRNEKISVASRFWFLLYPHKSILVQAIFGAAIFTILGLTTAIYVQKIIDRVLPSLNLNLLNVLSIAMILLLILQIIVNAIKSIFILKTGQQIDAKLILGYYKHLLTLPQRFFETMRIGEIISRINDAVKIRSYINEMAIDLLINVFVVIFSFALMFTYYWKLAVIVILVIPIYLMIYLIANKLNKEVERKVMENSAELESQLVESINSVQTIKLFGLQFDANNKTETRFVKLLESIYKSGLNTVFTTNSSLFTSRLFTIVLLWVGAVYVMDQTITPGELISFYAIIGYFTGPAQSIIDANKPYQNAMIAADRLFEIMDLEAPNSLSRISLERTDVGDIQFKNVNFGYGSRKAVFENLDLEIKKGQLTSIIGDSGSGKSTIVYILTRLYPIVNGRVMIGNYELNSIKDESFNELISVVPQTIDLFAGSIMENITLSKFEPDTQRVIKIAHELGILEFINELPGGFESPLGENGVNLSGGQRQRLGILRALYKDPEIIIFDEATSGLDSKSDLIVLETLLRLRREGKTIINISHKLTALTSSDQIIMLKNGNLIGKGSHHELSAVNEAYRNLWKRSENLTI